MGSKLHLACVLLGCAPFAAWPLALHVTTEAARAVLGVQAAPLGGYDAPQPALAQRASARSAPPVLPAHVSALGVGGALVGNRFSGFVSRHSRSLALTRRLTWPLLLFHPQWAVLPSGLYQRCRCTPPPPRRQRRQRYGDWPAMTMLATAAAAAMVELTAAGLGTG